MKNDEIRKVITEGGMVFKKKANDEMEGDKKLKLSNFLHGTHYSDSAKWKASFKYKRALRNSQRKK
jgi:hypothetical protein